MVSKRGPKAPCKTCTSKTCLCKLLRVPENKNLNLSQRGPEEEEEFDDDDEDDESIFSFEYEMKEYNDYLDHLLAYQLVKDAYNEKLMRE